MNKTKKTLPIISEEEEKEIRLFSRFRNERPYIHKNADEKDTNAQIRLMYEDDVANLIKNINDNDSIFPRIDDSNTKITEIPQKILVGQDLFNAKQGVYADLLNGGNIWLEISDTNNETADVIDDFLVSYIFKIIEKFPLGRARFFIIDKERHWCYEKIVGNLCSNGANTLCKNAVTIISEKESQFLDDIKSQKCTEISQKMSTGINNIFDLCEVDPDEAVHFVIIRDPINQSSELIQKLAELTTPDERTHKCGFRFLTIYNNAENSTDHNLNSLQRILKNCEIQYKITSNGAFMLSTECIIPLSTSGIDPDGQKPHVALAITASNNLAEKLRKLSIVSIKHQELWSKDFEKQFDESTKSARLEIPVGKSGRNIFSLPFSVANDDNSDNGQIVNYMVAGSTGSGKSSLMHSIIINGAWKYSPNDLRFWIIDFKSGQESNKYRDANIPHIELLSSQNTQNDALYIFQMIYKEMKRRQNLLKDRSINKYNEEMDKEKKPHLPRIIVIIDEAQELFFDNDDDSMEVIQNLTKSISDIAQKCRSAGIHLVLIAQNLSSGARLASSYLPSALGNIAFLLENEALSDTFNNNLLKELRNEINKLNVGTAYVRLSKEVHKVRFAFANNLNEYFEEIRNKCSKTYDHLKTKIVGEISTLYPSTNITEFWENGESSCYEKILSSLNQNNEQSNTQDAVIGENLYSLTPLNINFTNEKPSGLLIMGDSLKIGTSIVMSIIKSLKNAEKELNIINCDTTTYNGSNPLTAYCKNNHVDISPPSKMKERLKHVYREYLERKTENENSLEAKKHKPIYLIINQIDELEEFFKNETLFSANNDYLNTNEESGSLSELDNFFSQDNLFPGGTNNDINQYNEIDATKALKELIKNGHKCFIYVIIAATVNVEDIKFNLSEDFKRIVVCNNLNNLSLPFGSIYQTRDMLKSIRNIGEEETRALFITQESIIKIRPIIHQK